MSIDQRSIKATRMSVVQLAGPLFKIHSHDSGKDYNVYYEESHKPTCECPDFKHREMSDNNFRCAHIRAVELWKVKKQTGLENIVIVDQKDIVPDGVRCDDCGKYLKNERGLAIHKRSCKGSDL